MKVRNLPGVLIGAMLAVASVCLAPLASAMPAGPLPLTPVNGQACDDFDKLAYDPAVGQIVCAGGSWQLSVEPTGIRDMGTPCPQSEMDSTLASSTDGHLIWCPSYKGIWVLYTP